ncbi:c-type cytochrome [Hydrogenophaga sp.]|uniref:c-type cytochrome n=1 Tax=Hydrogenophaga sp. TaxID=1904254 RepID=UPI0019C9988A|nr:c-type cytochrome [Hydrogenophaga sp.]MBD3893429.1 cytochrome c4 [Hydrogenophaga sp.]
MKLSASLLCVAAAAALSLSVQAQQVVPDLTRGAALYNQMCMVCHGVNGNSTMPANPSLAQQHPEYLIKQLQDYKSGKRESAIMRGFAAALSDADKRDISFWLAAQTKTPGYAQADIESVQLGKRIFRGGIADRRIASCAACHGPGGAGIPAQFPRLAGQHAEYTISQMKAFRDGTRKNSPMMAGVAARMNDREIRAVSDYIAGLR